jgi:hypothetical protein
MKYYIASVFLLTLLFFSAGCKTTKSAQKGQKVVVAETKQPLTEWEKLVEECSKKNLQFKTISLSGKLSAEVPQQGNIDAAYRMNIMKDSMIWLKVTKMGLEGMRVLVTPTKIQVIDRLNSKVYIANFSKISKYVGIDVDFKTLQDLLLGNMPILPTKEVTLEKAEKENILKFIASGIDFQYTIVNENQKIAKVNTLQSAKNQSATLSYYEFEVVDNQLFSHNVVIEAKSKSAVNAELRHSKVEINPTDISFSFSIPDGYEVVKE